MAKFAQIDRVAELCRLKLSDEERELFAEQLGLVLEKFQRLSQVNTDGVAPMVTPCVACEPTRQDVSASSLFSSEIVEQFPQVDKRLLCVLRNSRQSTEDV